MPDKKPELSAAMKSKKSQRFLKKIQLIGTKFTIAAIQVQKVVLENLLLQQILL